MKKNIKVLLLEDDPNDAEFVKDCLSEYTGKENLFHARNGADALEFIFRNGKFESRSEDDDPQLIILDLKTPKVTGFEVLKKIRADERTKFVPVIIFTSSKEEKDLVNSYKLGANSFVVKPIKYGDFERTIKIIGEYWLMVNLL